MPGPYRKDVVRGAARRARPAATLRALIGERIGEYRVVSQLGAGGMGTVYEARDADDTRARFDVRWFLRKATGDRAHLAAATRLLDAVLEAVDEPLRDSMIEGVARNRELLAAWEREFADAATIQAPAPADGPVAPDAPTVLLWPAAAGRVAGTSSCAGACAWLPSSADRRRSAGIAWALPLVLLRGRSP